MRLSLYQTLEDRDNPDYVEEYGPFFCDRSTAWLGGGYYFWDTHIELGHWWGQLNYGGGYIICKAKAILSDLCWDLHGNGMHRLEFEELCKEMIRNGLGTKETLLVPQLIEFFKLKGGFKYDSIRALGINSINGNLVDKSLIFRMNFKRDKFAYLDLKPAVQICLVNKNSLGLHHYKIIYPQDYSEFYA